MGGGGNGVMVGGGVRVQGNGGTGAGKNQARYRAQEPGTRNQGQVQGPGALVS